MKNNTVLISQILREGQFNLTSLEVQEILKLQGIYLTLEEVNKKIEQINQLESQLREREEIIYFYEKNREA